MTNFSKVLGLSLQICNAILKETITMNSDQLRISPCDINAGSSIQVMRIKEMITKDEMKRYLNKFSQQVL